MDATGLDRHHAETGVEDMTIHLMRMLAVIGFVVACTIYPYLPGQFDGLAVALSMMAQVMGVVGVALVAVGVPWLAHEFRKRAARQRHLPIHTRGYGYALASVFAGSVVAVAVSLAAGTSGLAFALVAIVPWGYAVSRLVPALRRLKQGAPDGFNPVPVYLVVVPMATLLAQVVIAAPATESGRNRAIANSAELISDLEQYHAARGRYPPSVVGLWPDYEPAVVGVAQFHYAPTENAYSLFFELPVFLLRAPGTREIVMYNKRDEHLMLSHAAWNLTRSPEGLASAQGWYAVHDGSHAHWRSFLFD